MGLETETGRKQESTQVQKLRYGEGFPMEKGVYFVEIFSSIVKMTSIRTMMRIVDNMDLEA